MSGETCGSFGQNDEQNAGHEPNVTNGGWPEEGFETVPDEIRDEYHYSNLDSLMGDRDTAETYMQGILYALSADKLPAFIHNSELFLRGGFNPVESGGDVVVGLHELKYFSKAMRIILERHIGLAGGDADIWVRLAHSFITQRAKEIVGSNRSDNSLLPKTKRDNLRTLAHLYLDCASIARVITREEMRVWETMPERQDPQGAGVSRNQLDRVYYWLYHSVKQAREAGNLTRQQAEPSPNYADPEKLRTRNLIDQYRALMLEKENADLGIEIYRKQIRDGVPKDIDYDNLRKYSGISSQRVFLAYELRLDNPDLFGEYFEFWQESLGESMWGLLKTSEMLFAKLTSEQLGKWFLENYETYLTATIGLSRVIAILQAEELLDRKISSVDGIVSLAGGEDEESLNLFSSIAKYLAGTSDIENVFANNPSLRKGRVPVDNKAMKDINKIEGILGKILRTGVNLNIARELNDIIQGLNEKGKAKPSHRGISKPKPKRKNR
jgi:hypothetical protein